MILLLTPLLFHFSSVITQSNSGSDNGDMLREECSFLESFCWAVSNLADPGEGFQSNQIALIQIGGKENLLSLRNVIL